LHRSIAPPQKWRAPLSIFIFQNLGIAMRLKQVQAVVIAAFIAIASASFSQIAIAQTSASATPVKTAVSTDTEIAALFTYLEKSGCEFNRNGTWYNGSEAVTHIRKKLNYLQGKKRITDTESFITQAASVSSSSGKNYEVRCQGKAAVPSGDWFQAELAKMRKAK
jgi:Family of unknown function (DUF5329)